MAGGWSSWGAEGATAEDGAGGPDGERRAADGRLSPEAVLAEFEAARRRAADARRVGDLAAARADAARRAGREAADRVRRRRELARQAGRGQG